MAIINLKELEKELEHVQKGKKVVLVTGTFDLFHYEHLKFLEGAKQQGDILCVAVKSDKAARLKGEDRPIIKQEQRIAIVDAIKYVDYSFVVDYEPEKSINFQFDNEKQRQWLIMFQEVFKALKPDIFYYEKVSDLQSARNRVLEEYSIKGISKQRGESTSTTAIIKKLM